MAHEPQRNQPRLPKDDVILELYESFGTTLTLKTIEKVAERHNYDVDKTIVTLLELTTGEEINLNDDRPQNSERSSPSIRSSTKSNNILKRVCNDIKKGYKMMILLRGLPGSGKSVLARHILEECIDQPNFADHILSTDDYFLRLGRYNFDHEKLSDAHGWNRTRTFKAMLKGISPIIIDNTNTQVWEMKPYAEMAIGHGYLIEILEPNTEWRYNIGELYLRNQHNVPKTKLKEMLERYAKNITPEVLIRMYKLSYKKHLKIPQTRNFPPIILPLANVSSEHVVTPNKFNSMSLNKPRLKSTLQDTSNNGYQNHSNLIDFSDDNQIATNSTMETRIIDPNSNYSQSCGFVRASNDEVSYAGSSSGVNNLFNCEQAWGIDEKAMHNWGLVTPLTDHEEIHSIDLTETPDDHKEISRTEKSSNTYLSDFQKLPNSSEDIKCIPVRYRDINPPNAKITFNKSGMFDKSCSTEDDVLPNRDEDLCKLMDIFHNIPLAYIQDMYDKCNGSFEMTVDIFLEDNQDYSTFSLTSSITKPEISQDLLLSEATPFGENEQLQKKSKHCHSTVDCSQQSNLMDTEIFEEVGSFPKNKLLINSNYESVEPSTSHMSNMHNITSASDNVDMISLDSSDIDIEDWDNVSDKSSGKEIQEDLIELNLGDVFVTQLEKEFDPNNEYPKGFQPVVQIPKSLARQLYTFYVESVYQQMEAQNNILDQLVKEDETFAKKLQEQEDEVANAPISTSDEPLEVQNSYETLEENVTSDSIIEHLKEKKICRMFPTIHQKQVVELLHANANDYQQTVLDLVYAVDSKDIRGEQGALMEPVIDPILAEDLKQTDHICSREQQFEDGKPASYYREEANKSLKNRHELYEKAHKYQKSGPKEAAAYFYELAQRETIKYEQANTLAVTMLLDEHSRRLQNFDTLDLHYLYVKEAIPALDVFIDRNINLLKGGSKSCQSLLVITGRGNRSKNHQSKIKPAVISRLRLRQIPFVQMNPGLLKIKVTKTCQMTSDIKI